MPTTGNDIGPKLAEALGLQTDNLVEFVVYVPLNDTVKIDATYLAEDKLEEFTKRYQVVEVDEGE